MTIVTVGIDLAKNVFAVHGVPTRSRWDGRLLTLRPHFPRSTVTALWQLQWR
jgi:hypothetical protein